MRKLRQLSPTVQQSLVALHISHTPLLLHPKMATAKQPASKDKVDLNGILGKTPSVFGPQ